MHQVIANQPFTWCLWNSILLPTSNIMSSLHLYSG
jgi:hypothetical protein